MAAVSKTYGIGDTVFVAYPFGSSLYFTPQSRVVKQVDTITGTNEAVVNFENGEKVQDGVNQTIFLTSPLAAKKIVDDIIIKSATAVSFDTTTSSASTAGLASVSLRRASA